MASNLNKTNADLNRDLGRSDKLDRDTNPDPITGAPGSHPAGTAAGTTAGGLAGAAAGAAIGSVVPGIGTVIGAAVGTVVGGIGGAAAGHSIAEGLDPTAEDAYWRENHKSRPYYSDDSSYSYDEDYAPAYRYGWEARTRPEYQDRGYDVAENDLRSGWDKAKGKSRLEWEKAKEATRDAWYRVENKVRA